MVWFFFFRSRRERVGSQSEADVLLDGQRWVSLSFGGHIIWSCYNIYWEKKIKKERIEWKCFSLYIFFLYVWAFWSLWCVVEVWFHRAIKLKEIFFQPHRSCVCVVFISWRLTRGASIFFTPFFLPNRTPPPWMYFLSSRDPLVFFLRSQYKI